MLLEASTDRHHRIGAVGLSVCLDVNSMHFVSDNVDCITPSTVTTYFLTVFATPIRWTALLFPLGYFYLVDGCCSATILAWSLEQCRP